jgi:lysophospholipase L1-like esterase
MTGSSRKHTVAFIALLLSSATLHAIESGGQKVSVDSPAFIFSPGNWTGDAGRGGKTFRQTWSSGAYFRVAWESRSATPTAILLLDTSSFTGNARRPQIVYCMDGVWTSKVDCTNEIVVQNLAGAGRHELTVILQSSEQKERWGKDGSSGRNVLRVTGLQLDPDSKAVSTAPGKKWAMIIGDSITEGIGATELAAYSHLLGESLQAEGYDYCISACGFSGWLNRGDSPPGDVPGYFMIAGSENGQGGQYDDTASRWNKIDGNNHSLLDAAGHISAYGEEGQEPTLILINYGTNDALHKSNLADTLASMIQSLAALRKSAPDAQIIVLIPFGQYYAKELYLAVEIHKADHPTDKKISLIDLGPAVARTLATKNGLFGGLHPNDRGHAIFAAQIIPRVITTLHSPER